MTGAEKRAELQKLVARRQQGWLPNGCMRLGDFHSGYYECDFVVPWSATACNYNADLMLVAQDWASAEFLSQPITPRKEAMKALGRDEKLATNRNLKRLLHEHMGLKFSDVFATDLFPFIKPGKMDRLLSRKDLVRSASEFGIPQINIIHPLIVACLGRTSTFPAICDALGVVCKPSGDKSNLPLGPVLYEEIEIYGATHPGAWGAIGKRRMDIEWDFLAQRLLLLQKMRAGDSRCVTIQG